MTDVIMKSHRHYLFQVLAAVAVCLLLAACDKQPVEEEVIRAVRAVEITDNNNFSSRGLPGRANAAAEVNLAFRVDGPVSSLLVKVGDTVSEGDLLATIDPRDYEVALKREEANLGVANATLERARNEYQRELNIFREDSGATSQTAVDRKKEQEASALANVSALEAVVASASDRLSYTFLKAPFDGQIVATYVDNFEDIQAKEPVLRMVNADSVEMVISVPETRMSVLDQIETMSVVFDAFPELVIPATISEVGTEASQTTRTFPVTLTMSQPEGVIILAGMAGRAVTKLKSGDSPDIFVPPAAIFAASEGKNLASVWVIDRAAGVIHQREIEVEGVSSEGVRVTRGLSLGEWIVMAGVHYLTEGQKVRIVEAPRG